MIGRLRMRFDERRERLFVERYAAERERHFRTNALIGLALSTACCAWDFVLLPDITAWVVATRVLFFAAFAGATALNGRLGPHGREVAWTLLTVVASCLVTASTQMSHAPYRFAYCFIEIMMVMFTVTVMNLRLRYAATAIAAACAINFCNVWLGSIHATDQRVAIESFFILGAALSLLHAYHSEGRDRRTFLAEERYREAAAQLDEATRTDALTGLYNRRHLDEVAARAWASGLGVSAILLDVDHFKLFNDSRGHNEGDACLQDVAGAIAAAAAPEGTAFRFGGEEFLVILPGVDIANATMIAESLRRAVEEAAIPHDALGPRRVVTASIGVAACGAGEMTPAALTKAADDALYEAKRAGRNLVRSHAQGPERAQSEADALLAHAGRTKEAA